MVHFLHVFRTHCWIVVVLLLLAKAARAEQHDSLNVVLLGDSNTWQGGDDCSKPCCWSYWFKQAFAPASCVSYARSGATWTHTTTTQRTLTAYHELLNADNVIMNQVERLIDAADHGRQPEPHLIIIMAGTNDAWFQQKRPGIFAHSVKETFASDVAFGEKRAAGTLTSLADAVRYDCERLMVRFSRAELVLVTPPQSVYAGMENIRKVSNIIADCASYLSTFHQ